MKIPLDILHILLDATAGSTMIGGPNAPWRFSQETREGAFNYVLAQMKEDAVTCGGKPNGTKLIHPAQIMRQIIGHKQLNSNHDEYNYALFYAGNLVGFYAVYTNIQGKPLVKWERFDLTYPGRGIDIERGNITQEEASSENEIIHKMLEHKFGAIVIKE